MNYPREQVDFLPRERRNIILLDHAAGDARPAAAKGSRLVGIVVAASMDHERAPLDVGCGQISHMQLGLHILLGIGGYKRQIALVPMLAWAFVFACMGGIIMSPCG